MGYKESVSFVSIYSNMVNVRGAAKSTEIMYVRDNAEINMKSMKKIGNSIQLE